MKIERFEDIEAWKEARDIVNRVYRVCSVNGFRKDYSLADQIKRAAISIMANIAEGYERGGRKEFVQFLSVAKGSVGEVRSHLYVALDQAYCTKGVFDELTALAIEISRMISGLMSYLISSKIRGAKNRYS